MDKRLIDLTAGPTAIVASAVNERRQTSLPTIPGRRVAEKARTALPVVLDRLPTDEVAQLLRPNQLQPKLRKLLPHRSPPSRRQQTIRLARNLAVAASATVFAVDLVSEVKRAAEAGGRSSLGGPSGNRGNEARKRAGSPPKPATKMAGVR